jgi:hypothetical protein
MFIGRRQDGTVYGCWSVRQVNDADHPRQEEVADDHPDLVAFRAPRPVVVSRREAAIEAMLTKAAEDPLAPQEIKDYVESKTR